MEEKELMKRREVKMMIASDKCEIFIKPFPPQRALNELFECGFT